MCCLSVTCSQLTNDDQLLLIPAFLGAVMWTTLVVLCCVRYGTDRHTWDVPLDEFENSALYGAFLAEIAFLISTCCTKVSILLFYRRLTEGTYNKKWKWATIAAIVFTVVFCIGFGLVLCLQCRPTEAYWRSLTFTYTDNYKCADTKILNPISGALSVVSDFYSVLLPMAMTRHFDIDRRKKIALNAVFSLGLLVVAAGAIRTWYLTKLGYDYDITWFGYDVFVWATLELQLAIMCACAPALRALFRHYFKDSISRAMQTASSRSGGRSQNRSAQRDSKHVDTASVAGTHDAMDYNGNGDKKLIPHPTKQSMGTVDEREIDESFTSVSPSEPHAIKTPADFEAYALQNLERYRASSYERPPTRHREEYAMQQRPQVTQTRWHDTDSDYSMQQRPEATQPQWHERREEQYPQYHATSTPYTNYERTNYQYSQQPQYHASTSPYAEYAPPTAPYSRWDEKGTWLDNDSR